MVSSRQHLGIKRNQWNPKQGFAPFRPESEWQHQRVATWDRDRLVTSVFPEIAKTPLRFHYRAENPDRGRGDPIDRGFRRASNQVYHGSPERVEKLREIKTRREVLGLGKRQEPKSPPSTQRTSSITRRWNKVTSGLRNQVGDVVPNSWTSKVSNFGEDAIKFGGKAVPIIDFGFYAHESYNIHRKQQSGQISAEEARIRYARMVGGAAGGYAGPLMTGPLAPLGAVAGEYYGRMRTEKTFRNPYQESNDPMTAAAIESYVKWDSEPLVEAVQQPRSTLQSSGSVMGFSPDEGNRTTPKNSARANIVEMKRNQSATHSVEAKSSSPSNSGELPIEPLEPIDNSSTNDTGTSVRANRAKENKRARSEPTIVNKEVRIDPSSIQDIDRRIEEAKQEAVREMERRFGPRPTQF